MSEGETCPKCGSGLSPGALEGLCARCLAELALGLEPTRAAEPAKSPQTAPPPPAAQAESSARVFGDYELLQEIARGGRGVLYKARQRSLNRIVAVKMIEFGEFASEAFVRRFQAEAQAAANLHHPNIVAIHEVGEQGGQHYFSMDYVKGSSLAALSTDHPLPARRAADYVRKIAQAIHYAHENGILHRDLKPSNVLIGADDEPRITDFGLAKCMADDSELTTTREVLGSPAYLPPEQCGAGFQPASSPGFRARRRAPGASDGMPPEPAGRNAERVGPPSDVYSLGAILYQLLTGRPPFVGETVEDTLGQVLKSEPVAPRLLNPAAPPDLETLCLKCLEKNPQSRYASARELADELGRFLRGEPIRARSVTVPEKFRRWCRRKPALAAAMALLVLVIAGSTSTAIHLARLHRTARWNVYATEVNQAHYEWQNGSFAQAFYHLQRHIPRDGEPDLRGFEWRHLWRLTRGNYSFKLPQQPRVIGSLMYSTDGKSLATFSWDKSDALKVWDLQNRRERFRIAEATSFGGFSANGAWLVAGSKDGAVKVYDAETGKLIFSIPRIGGIVAFAAGGNTLAAMDTNRAVAVLKLETQRAAPIVTNVTRRYFDYGKGAPLALAPDGRSLALVRPGVPSDREDRAIEIWDTVNRSLRTFLEVKRQIRTLQFSPDGQLLAVGDGDGGVRLWNWETTEARAFTAHELPILSLAFSSDGRTLATGSADETIQLWDVATLGQNLKKFEGQIGAVWSLAFSPDGKYLASGGRDSPVRFWDLAATPPVEVISNLRSDKIGNFTFSPDGRLMAGGCRDNTVRIWSVATMTEQYQLKDASYVVVFTSDGRQLLASTADGIAQWWDFKAGTTKSVPQYAGLGQVTSVDLSSDRPVAAVGREDGLIQLLEIDSGKVLGTYHGHDDAVLSVTFAPGGKRFASGSRDKTIRVWDATISEKSLQVCAEHNGAVGALAISSDGKIMASGSSANSIKFWDLRRLSRSSFASISWHQSAIRTLAFAPDNRILASGSEDKAVKLWDCVSRRQLASFTFDDAIRVVAFSPDGNHLAVITDKGALRLLRSVTLAEADGEISAFYAPGPNF